MAEEKKSHTLLYAGLAAAAVLGFAWWRSQQVTTAAPATTVPSGGTSTVTPNTTPWFQPQNASIAQYIKTWMLGATPAQQASLNAYLANYATQTDISNLYTVVSQYFNAGQGLASNTALNGWWDQFATEIGW
jgi:hypothetical protein